MPLPDRPLVGIIMGSASDSRVMRGAAAELDGLGVAHEDQIVSAHRTPARLDGYARHAEESGFRVIIAGAGGAAHLPGMIASHTYIPVVGVPIMVYNDSRGGEGGHRFSAFGGLDSLLSITEMPSGSPVASVGVNKAGNAGIYAARLLSGEFPGLRERLQRRMSERAAEVSGESDRMRDEGLAGFSPGGA